MSSNNPLVKAVAATNSGQRLPVLSLVQSNPELAAAISKLVNPVVPAKHGQNGNREIMSPNVMQLRQTANRTSRSAADAEMTMQMLPDTELSAQILVAAVISPTDMQTVELTFSAPEGVLDAQTSSALLLKLRAHFDQVYKIKPLLQKILRDMLFDKGSHVRAVIPESSVDELINRHVAIKMEDIKEIFGTDNHVVSLGILGSGIESIQAEEERREIGGLSMEAFQEYTFKTAVSKPINFAFESEKDVLRDELLTVTDNPEVLKVPDVQALVRSQRINRKLFGNRIFGTAMEAQMLAPTDKKLNDREMTSAMYRDPSHVYTPINTMRTQEQLNRHTIGNPLIMELPSESVIPVHVPGQEENHIGYFVLLDINGHPLSRKNNHDYYAELSERMNTSQGQSFPSTLLQRIKSMTTGFDCMNSEHLDYSTRVYADMVEADLLARLRNGVYTNGVAIARNEEIYRIMLARTLARQKTQLLFLPIELVTYFAFRFNADGIGKSLLDDMRVLNSLRAMTMFANVMASVKNSIGHTNVNLKLDGSEPDPKKAIEILMDEIVRGRQQSFPLGTSSPVDLVNWLQRASYYFTYEGHPGLPDIKVEMSQSSTNYPKPDVELENELRKRSIMATGLNPETVDKGFEGEFATSVVANNILLTRRVMQLQDLFTPQLSDHLRKVAMSSQQLVDDLRQILLENYDKIKPKDPEELKLIVGGSPNEQAAVINTMLFRFMNGMVVSLPQPNTVTIENQQTSLENYVKLLDTCLDAYLSEEFFNASGDGVVAANIAQIKKIVRAHFMRGYMAENGIMPELASITSTDEDGKPSVNFWESQKEHMSALFNSMADLLAKLQPAKDDATKVVEAAGVPADGGGGGFGGGGFGGGGFGGGSDLTGGGGDDLGGGPAGLGDELGGGNEPGSDTTPPATGEEETSAAPAKKADDEEGLPPDEFAVQSLNPPT